MVDGGPTAEVLTRPRHPYTRGLIAAIPSFASRGRRLTGAPDTPVVRRLRPRLQYVPQDALSSFDPRYRVADLIGENLAGHGRADKTARIAELLEQVGLPADCAARHPSSLSGGQRWCVSIARALAAEPALIVCDEPVSALDIGIQAQVLDLLADLRARLDTALLFISHDLGVIRHLADRVLVFHRGRQVEQGSVDAVLGDPTEASTKTLLASQPRLERDRTFTADVALSSDSERFVRGSILPASPGPGTIRTVRDRPGPDHPSSVGLGRLSG